MGNHLHTMNANNLGQLQRIDLREIWNGEATDFTPWLAQDENLALLGETLGIELEKAEPEKGVGIFRADILCKEAETGRVVVIENQLEETDHNHLGQLMTYSAGLKASIVVWVAQEFNEEHRAALDWLNEISGGKTGFFGVEIELWKIGDSAPAPKFNIVSEPNNWADVVKQTAQLGSLSKADELRMRYWAALIQFQNSLNNPPRIKEARPFRYLPVRSPIPNFRCGFEIYLREQEVGVYFGTRSPEQFELLRRIQRDPKINLSEELGEKIEWYEQTGSFWICSYKQANPADEKDWPTQHKWMTDTLQKLLLILPQHISS